MIFPQWDGMEGWIVEAYPPEAPVIRIRRPEMSLSGCDMFETSLYSVNFEFGIEWFLFLRKWFLTNQLLAYLDGLQYLYLYSSSPVLRPRGRKHVHPMLPR